MLVTGIFIAMRGRLTGWQRYTPLLVGLWLPFVLLLWALFSRTQEVLLVGNIYSAVTWSLMAVAILTQPEERGKSEQERQFFAQEPAFK